jgi:hypothetical protein
MLLARESSTSNKVSAIGAWGPSNTIIDVVHAFIVQDFECGLVEGPGAHFGVFAPASYSATAIPTAGRLPI